MGCLWAASGGAGRSRMGGRERGASKWNITGGAQDAAGLWALRLRVQSNRSREDMRSLKRSLQRYRETEGDRT